MRVADWMSPDPMTVRPTVSAEGAAALLRHYRVRHLPVVDRDGELVGMISDRDLVTGVIGGGPRHLPGAHAEDLVEELMSSPVLTVQPEEDLDVAARRMLADRISALAVVDGGGQLVGVLTTTDCLLALLAPARASRPDDADVALRT